MSQIPSKLFSRVPAVQLHTACTIYTSVFGMRGKAIYTLANMGKEGGRVNGREIH